MPASEYGVPSIVDMSLEDWRRQTAINLDGVFLSVKHCLPLMRKTGGGSIIMMSSLAGLRGAAGSVRLLRDQGRRPAVRQGDRDGVRDRSATASASTRCIPASSTRRSGARFRRKRPGADRTRRSIPKSAPKWQRRWPAPARPRRSRSGVLYLASDASRYVTGTELVIDGGMNAGGVARRREWACSSLRGAKRRSNPFYVPRVWISACIGRIPNDSQ